eukprot:GDKJ01041364.1.p1 GENE.GDKJ01041364.1~~GDKJ01041364.1.p1  ORF type:complete len:934 (+),score=264.49 GDKJ01041364.1:1932-4733(+)
MNADLRISKKTQRLIQLHNANSLSGGGVSMMQQYMTTSSIGDHSHIEVSNNLNNNVNQPQMLGSGNRNGKRMLSFDESGFKHINFAALEESLRQQQQPNQYNSNNNSRYLNSNNQIGHKYEGASSVNNNNSMNNDINNSVHASNNNVMIDFDSISQRDYFLAPEDINETIAAVNDDDAIDHDNDYYTHQKNISDVNIYNNKSRNQGKKYNNPSHNFGDKTNKASVSNLSNLNNKLMVVMSGSPSRKKSPSSSPKGFTTGELLNPPQASVTPVNNNEENNNISPNRMTKNSDTNLSFASSSKSPQKKIKTILSSSPLSTVKGKVFSDYAGDNDDAPALGDGDDFMFSSSSLEQQYNENKNASHSKLTTVRSSSPYHSENDGSYNDASQNHDDDHHSKENDDTNDDQFSSSLLGTSDGKQQKMKKKGHFRFDPSVMTTDVRNGRNKKDREMVMITEGEEEIYDDGDQNARHFDQIVKDSDQKGDGDSQLLAKSNAKRASNPKSLPKKHSKSRRSSFSSDVIQYPPSHTSPHQPNLHLVPVASAMRSSSFNSASPNDDKNLPLDTGSANQQPKDGNGRPASPKDSNPALRRVLSPPSPKPNAGQNNHQAGWNGAAAVGDAGADDNFTSSTKNSALIPSAKLWWGHLASFCRRPVSVVFVVVWTVVLIFMIVDLLFFRAVLNQYRPYYTKISDVISTSFTHNAICSLIPLLALPRGFYPFMQTDYDTFYAQYTNLSIQSYDKFFSIVDEVAKNHQTVGRRTPLREALVYHDYCFIEPCSLARPVIYTDMDFMFKGLMRAIVTLDRRVKQLPVKYFDGLDKDFDAGQPEIFFPHNAVTSDVRGGMLALRLSFEEEALAVVVVDRKNQYAFLICGIILIMVIVPAIVEFVLRKQSVKYRDAMLLLNMIPSRLLEDYRVIERVLGVQDEELDAFDTKGSK